MDGALFDPRVRSRAQLRLVTADGRSRPSDAHPRSSHPHRSRSQTLTSAATPSVFDSRSAVRAIGLAGVASGLRARVQLSGPEERDRGAVPRPEVLVRRRLRCDQSVHFRLRALHPRCAQFRLRSCVMSIGRRLRRRSVLLAVSRFMRRSRHRARVPRRTRRVPRRRGLRGGRAMHRRGRPMEVRRPGMRAQR